MEIKGMKLYILGDPRVYKHPDCPWDKIKFYREQFIELDMDTLAAKRFEELGEDAIFAGNTVCLCNADDGDDDDCEGSTHDHLTSRCLTVQTDGKFDPRLPKNYVDPAELRRLARGLEIIASWLDARRVAK